MMTRILITLICIAVPYTACADCKITDTSEKFEVVCFDLKAASPASASKKKAHTQRGVYKAKKVNFEERVTTMQVVVMSAEESQFMQIRNQQDGLRVKRKSGERPGKKIAEKHDAHKS